MSSLRTGKFQFNVRSLARNRELRSLLTWLTANPNKSILDISIYMSCSQPKARNAVDTLRQANLVYVSDSDLSAFHTSINLYSVRPHGEHELDTHLPVTRPEHLPAPGGHYSKAKAPAPRSRIMRDPLTAMLMGEGRAPSLNFIDSLKGVFDVKPKAAHSTH